MSEYRDYLRNTTNRTNKKQKKRQYWIILFILVLALVFYLYESGNLDTLCDKFEENEAIETINEMVKVLKSATVGDRELPIYCVDTKEKEVALSFDAAWGAEDFNNIMDILDKHKVKVTFFMTGGWVDENPECVKTLVEKGHDLGNHSVHHYDMTTISKEQMKTEINDVGKKVEELTGYKMKLFRPPYGAYNNDVIKATYECGYFPIQWNVDSLDWKNYGVQSIIDTVCNHKDLGPGSIILCHNGAKYTAKALDEMLTQLEEKGYKIVPISKLIMTEKYHMDATGKQIAD